MGGFLRKLNPFDRDDDKDKQDEQQQTGRQSDQQSTAASSEPIMPEPVARAGVGSGVSDIVAQAEAANAARPPAPATPAVATPASTEGKVSGSGLNRTYVTKAGDKLEDIAAYFYGAAVQKQRLIDDNAWLQAYDGKVLPANMTINVSEDPNRGDAVPSS